MPARTTKLLIGCILVILFALGAFYSIRYINAREQRRNFSRKLAEAVEKKWSNNNAVEVRLKDLTDFTWDRVYIFNPYTSTEKIDKDLDYVWQSAGHTSIYTLDAVILLVFTHKGRVVFYMDLPRYPVDFRGNYKQDGYSPGEAIFNIVKKANQDNGLHWFHLIWKWGNPPT